MIFTSGKDKTRNRNAEPECGTGIGDKTRNWG